MASRPMPSECSKSGADAAGSIKDTGSRSDQLRVWCWLPAESSMRLGRSTLHTAPQADKTVKLLAEIAAVSRSTFLEYDDE